MRVRNPHHAIAVTVAFAVAGCSEASTEVTAPTAGRIVTAVSIDWEGAYISSESLDCIDALREQWGDAVPLTHFVSAGYYVKPELDPLLDKTFTEMLRPGDELAVHLHGWQLLAAAAKIEPRRAPSFLSGTDQLLELDGGDLGFDLDLDAYTVAELRALLRTSRELLGRTNAPVSSSFRAGGYLGTAKMLQAVRDEGFAVDSSALDYRPLQQRKGELLADRVQQIWPNVEAGAQPWLLPSRVVRPATLAPSSEVGSVDPQHGLLEMPIAAVADYSTAAEVQAIFGAASAKLDGDPTRNVFVTLAFHQETCEHFGSRLMEGIVHAQRTPAIADRLTFVTVEAAGRMARASLAAR